MNRRRTWTAISVGSVLLSGTSWWIGAHSQSPNQAAAKAREPAASWITAKVEYRRLSSTIITRGDVVTSDSLTVQAPASVAGVAVITSPLPVLGSSVTPGQVLAEVSGRPVFALRGNYPMFREMVGGMRGVDVRQLQAALRSFTPSLKVTGLFDPPTKSAVASFYRLKGYAPVPSSTKATDVISARTRAADASRTFDATSAELDRASNGQRTRAELSAQRSLAAARGALSAARNARASAIAAASSNEIAEVTRAQDALVAEAEQTVEEADSALSDSRLQNTVAKLRIAVADARAASAAAVEELASAQAALGPSVPLGEIAFIPQFPATVKSVGSTNPDAPGPSDAPSAGGLMTIAAGTSTVRTTIDDSGAALMTVGAEVQILDEATKRTYRGTVTSISPDSSVDSTGTRGHATTIAPDTALPPAAIGKNFRVTFTTTSTLTKSLVVPASAITARPDGTTTVSVLPSGSKEPNPISVVASVSADGYVAITTHDPAALREGDRVVVGK